MLRSTLVAASALLALGTALLPTAAAADEPAENSGDVAWSMMPVITDVGEERSNFAYSVDAGEVLTDAVLVRNSGTTALDLTIYGSDAFTDETGALDIATGDAADASVGGWIDAAASDLHLEPGGVVRVPFTVTVPADAQPGQHAGALLTARESSGDTIAVDMRYATRVTVTVSGELTAGLSVDDAGMAVSTGFWPWEPASAEVSYAVRNTGNTSLSAVQLISASGVEVYSSPAAENGLLPLGELLPEASVDVAASIDGLSAWSPFATAEVSVSPTVLGSATDALPSIDQTQVAVSAVAIAPGWWVLLGGAVVIAGVVVVLARRRRRAAPPALDASSSGAGTASPAPEPTSV